MKIGPMVDIILIFALPVMALALGLIYFLGLPRKSSGDD
jgi:heme/copper-type cytochrome/quinol oxidase subunit 4